MSRVFRFANICASRDNGAPGVLRPYEISAIKSLAVKLGVVPLARLQSVMWNR